MDDSTYRINFLRAYQEMILDLTKNKATFKRNSEENTLEAEFTYNDITILIFIPYERSSLDTNITIALNYEYEDLTAEEQALLSSIDADSIYVSKILKPWREHYKYLGFGNSTVFRRTRIYSNNPSLWITKEELISVYNNDGNVTYAIKQLERYIRETLDEYVVPFEQLIDMTKTFLENVLDVEEI